MSREAILKCTMLGAVSALWIGVIVACGNEQPAENTDQDQHDTPEPSKEPAKEPAKEPPPPPPPEPTASADGGAAPATADGGAATADADGGAAPAACGRPGQPMCPLQEYMKRTMLPAMRANDHLDASFAVVAGWAPDPSWNDGPTGWRTQAEAGVTAAKATNKAGVQAACKGCHTAWQKRYRAEFRQRPLPPH